MMRISSLSRHVRLANLALPSTAAMAAAASLSTQTEAAVAAALNQVRWSDCRDEVTEIAKLMREGTTNHSVPLPSIDLQHQVNDHLRGLHRLVEAKQHNEAFHQVHSLKAMVKDELYRHRHPQQQQVMSFSTAAHRQQYDFDENSMQAVVNQMNALQKEHQVDAAKTKKNNDTAVLTTATHAVRALETKLGAIRWADVKNEIQEVSNMMREGEMNRAVPLPSVDLAKTILEQMHQVDALTHHHNNDVLSNAKARAKAFKLIHDLKSMMKAELYQ